MEKKQPKKKKISKNKEKLVVKGSFLDIIKASMKQADVKSDQ